MSDLFWLTDEQTAQLRPFCPKSNGKLRVDLWHVMSGIIFINRNGLHWRSSPRSAAVTSPPDTAGGGERVRSDDEGWPPRAPLGHHHDRRDLSKGVPWGFEPACEKGGRGRMIGCTKKAA